MGGVVDRASVSKAGVPGSILCQVILKVIAMIPLQEIVWRPMLCQKISTDSLRVTDLLLKQHKAASKQNIILMTNAELLWRDCAEEFTWRSTIQRVSFPGAWLNKMSLLLCQGDIGEHQNVDLLKCRIFKMDLPSFAFGRVHSQVKKHSDKK